MQFLYDQLDYLPVWARPSVAAFLTVIIGYFISKILAAVISNVFQKHDEDLVEGERSFGSKLARFTFWALWSFFIGIGITQLPLTHAAFSKWDLSQPNFQSIIRIIALTLIFFFSENILLQLGSNIKNIWRKTTFSKSNKAIQKFLLIAIVLLLATMTSSTLSNPAYIIVAIYLLSFGFLLSKIIKEIISSGFDVLNVNKSIQNRLSQFSMYFVISTFVLTAFEIWI